MPNDSLEYLTRRNQVWSSGGHVSNNRQHERAAQADWLIDQAVAKGDLAIGDAERAREVNPHTWWDRTWGYKTSSGDMMGEVSQPFFDTLMTANYAVKAYTTAFVKSSAAEGNAIEIGNFKIGFSTEAFKKSFNNRETFIHLMDTFEWGPKMTLALGLGMDIALDPLTYLTLGVGAGAKVAANAGTKIGGKTLQKSTMLTMNNHGSEIFNFTARKFRPIVRKKLIQQNINLSRLGLQERKHLEQTGILMLHNEIGQHMIKNYDTLAKELYHSKSAFKKWLVLPSSKNALTSRLRTGMDDVFFDGDKVLRSTADDMFEETARALHKQRGFQPGVGTVVGAGVGAGIVGSLSEEFTDSGFFGGIGLLAGGYAGLKITRHAFAATGVSKVFQRTAGVPEDVSNKWFEVKGAVSQHLDDVKKDIDLNLGDMDDNQRKIISHLLEMGDQAAIHGEDGSIIGAMYGINKRTNELAGKGKEAKAKLTKAQWEARRKLQSELATEDGPLASVGPSGGKGGDITWEIDVPVYNSAGEVVDRVYHGNPKVAAALNEFASHMTHRRSFLSESDRARQSPKTDFEEAVWEWAWESGATATAPKKKWMEVLADEFGMDLQKYWDDAQIARDTHASVDVSKGRELTWGLVDGQYQAKPLAWLDAELERLGVSRTNPKDDFILWLDDAAWDHGEKWEDYLSSLRHDRGWVEKNFSDLGDLFGVDVAKRWNTSLRRKLVSGEGGMWDDLKKAEEGLQNRFGPEWKTSVADDARYKARIDAGAGWESGRGVRGSFKRNLASIFEPSDEYGMPIVRADIEALERDSHRMAREYGFVDTSSPTAALIKKVEYAKKALEGKSLGTKKLVEEAQEAARGGYDADLRRTKQLDPEDVLQIRIEELALEMAGHQIKSIAALRVADDVDPIVKAANIKTAAMWEELDKLDALGKHIRAKATRRGTKGFGKDLWDKTELRYKTTRPYQLGSTSSLRPPLEGAETRTGRGLFSGYDLNKIKDEVRKTSDRWHGHYNDVLEQTTKAVGLKGIPENSNPFKHFEEMIDGFDGDGAKIADYLTKNLTDPFHRAVIGLLKPYLPENLRVSYGPIKQSLFDILKGKTLAHYDTRTGDIRYTRGVMPELGNSHIKMEGMSARTIVHEFVHAATSNRLKDARLAQNAGTPLGKLADELDGMLEMARVVRDEIDKVAKTRPTISKTLGAAWEEMRNSKPIVLPSASWDLNYARVEIAKPADMVNLQAVSNIEHGVKNTDELLAMAFQGGDTTNWMNGIYVHPEKGALTARTLREQWVDWMRGLLGFEALGPEAGTLLDEVLSAGKSVMKADVDQLALRMPTSLGGTALKGRYIPVDAEERAWFDVVMSDPGDLSATESGTELWLQLEMNGIIPNRFGITQSGEGIDVSSMDQLQLWVDKLGERWLGFGEVPKLPTPPESILDGSFMKRVTMDKRWGFPADRPKGLDEIVSGKGALAAVSTREASAARPEFASPEVVRGLNWARNKFKEIADREMAERYAIESIEDYVYHAYKTDGMRKFALSRVRREGTSIGSGKGGFLLHRKIATIEEAIEIYGPGKIEEDIGKIIARREAASIKMIEHGKFRDHIKLTNAFALMQYDLAIEGAKQGSAMLKLLRVQGAKEAQQIEYDQVYSFADSTSVKLGFREAKGARRWSEDHNMNLIRRLSLEVRDRVTRRKPGDSPLGEFASVFKKISSETKMGNIEFDPVFFLSQHYDGKQDYMMGISRALSKHESEIDLNDIQRVVNHIDTWSRKQMNTPINEIFPSMLDDIKKDMLSDTRWVVKKGKRKGQLLAGIEKKMDSFAKRLRNKNDGLIRQVAPEPQLPETVALTAQFMRLRYGDFSDLTRATAHQVGRLHAAANHHGIKGENLAQLMKLRLGHGDLSKLTSREADGMYNFLRGYDPGHFSTVADSPFGEKLVRVTFDDPKRVGHIEDVDMALGKSIAREEETLAQQIHATKSSFVDRRIARAEAQIDQMTGDAGARLKRDGDTAAHDQTMDEVERIKSRLDDLVNKKTALLEEPPEPTTVRDRSRYRDKSVLLTMNKDTLAPSEYSWLEKKFGFHRNKFDFGKLFGREGSKEVRARIRAEKNRIRAIEQEMADLEAQGAKVGDEEKNFNIVEDPTTGFKHYTPILPKLSSYSGTFRKWFKGSKAIDKEGNPVVFYRGGDERAGALTPHEGSAVYASDNPYVANTYAGGGRGFEDFFDEEMAISHAGGAVTPFHAKVDEVIEFNTLEGWDEFMTRSYQGVKNGELDKFGFDDASKKLKPGQALVARGTRDTGPSQSIKTDPERLSSYASDIWAFPKGTELKPLIGTARPAGSRLKKLQSKLDRVKSSLEDNKIEILNDGKYRVKGSGQVRDIIVKGRNNPQILGRHAEEIRRALISEAVLHGRKKAEFWTPMNTKDLPHEWETKTYILPESTANLLKEIDTPHYDPNTPNFNKWVLKPYDFIINTFKIPLLAVWGSTWMRNAIGNVTLAYVNAGISMFHPEHLRDFRVMYHYALLKESPKYRKLMGVKGLDDPKLAELGNHKVKAIGDGMAGGPMTVAELHPELARRGIFTGHFRNEIFHSELPGPAGRVQGAVSGALMGGALAGPQGILAGAAIGGVVGRQAYTMKNMFKAGELATELPTRLMLGLTKYKTSGSLEVAGQSVRRYLHDYSELSTFEKRFIRRLIPFYNFTKMAVRATSLGTVTAPARVSLPYKLFTDQNVLSDVMPEDIPDWYHHQLTFLSKEYDEETGEWKSWVGAGLMSPVEEAANLADIIAPGGQSILRMGSRGPFAFMSAIEYATNFDTFRMGKIYPEVSQGIYKTPFQSARRFKNAPEWMRNLVQYDAKTETVNPKIAWLLGEIPHSRFAKVAQQIHDADGPQIAGMNFNALSRVILGATVHKFDAKTQQYWTNEAKIDAMENVLANIGYLSMHNVTYPNKGIVKPARKSAPRRSPIIVPVK